MEYSVQQIRAWEEKWKKCWEESGLYRVEEDTARPKQYILDMFPYPSGSGLHVGHPLGYVASDIYARYKTLKGFNVLHPMGFDAFGLPAEQYAVETGQHPALTTEKNIARFREQLMNMGFCFDWSRAVKTSDPAFYKWTQWIFMQLFSSWYNVQSGKAEPVETLIALLEKEGSDTLCDAGLCTTRISASAWARYSGKEKQQFLMQFRLAYLDEAEVWWCEALGTVLANDEVHDGVSERGGHPVERIRMRQWFLRMTAYADRLLAGLETLEWSEAMKEMQRNWIGRSEGALLQFALDGMEQSIEVFTTRPDTIYGATFMVLAPEHPLVAEITAPENKKAVAEYIAYVKSRSERERISEVKKVSGQFTGAYALHPLTGEKLPVYIAEYVLLGYGTGAIMAVPAHDARDRAFAGKFGLPVIEVVDQSAFPNASSDDKTGIMQNSPLIDGMQVSDAIRRITAVFEEQGIGKRKIQFRLRDAGFSRQRYWGEPFPVYYKDGMPYLLDEKDLPVKLPEVDSYKPSGTAKSPLAALKDWADLGGGKTRETDTMPGYAGSSWYFYRYMDPHNENAFASKEAIGYWKNVDLYIGGTEHAVGHLLYARMWNMFLFDRGWVEMEEPFQKLVNQGMILGVSQFVLRLALKKAHETAPVESTIFYISDDVVQKYSNDKLFSDELLELIEVQSDKYSNAFEIKFKSSITYWETVRIPTELVENGIVDIEALKTLKSDFAQAQWIKNEFGDFHSHIEQEKMSKSKFNVINPDDVIAEYGADCFRMYEMFLGPLDAGKPWDTQGITGVAGFLRKLWRLYFEEDGNSRIMDRTPSDKERKILYRTVKKVEEDIERLSFNTAVSACMICVNELTALQCSSREILRDLLIVLAPFAPFTAETLWGHIHGYGESEFTPEKSVHRQHLPAVQEEYLAESAFDYPVSVNGKLRASIGLPLDISQEEVEKAVLALEQVRKWTGGEKPKRIIYVKGRIINIVT